MSAIKVSAGRPDQLGVIPDQGGVNIAVPSINATRIEFCLFDEAGEREVARIALPERDHATFFGYVAGVPAGARYGLRAHGPFAPDAGHRFNPNKLLVDPFARAIDRPFRLARSMFGLIEGDPAADLSFDATDSAPDMPKGVVLPLLGPVADTRPRVPWHRTVIYEMHVKGFTRLHPDVPERVRGTLAGLAEPAAVDHLAGLGVTTLELLPIAGLLDERHLAAAGLVNYWGYNPITYSAVDPRLLASGQVEEFALAIERLHAAGIEVILDVVYNHSGEGDELGPTVSFRGLDNALYYRLIPDRPRYYINDAGCGNVLAVERLPVLRLVMDSLRHWARLGVDGFRFDLATTVARTPAGFDPAGGFLMALRQDPELAALKLIAEPWDIGPGGWQTGNFPPPLAEWNDRFRDDVRRFWRGDDHALGALATRLSGSPDFFARQGRRPSASVNYVAAHDGFSLRDLVSYDHKHNEANLENNRDGHNDNHSWNHGWEGPSDDPVIVGKRRDDLRSLLATLLLARGTPMLRMGDELGQTLGGNNNAYCQDNRTNWLDWSAIPAEADGLAGLVRQLIELRQLQPALHADRFLTGDTVPGTGFKDVTWRREDGAELDQGEWQRPDRRFLGVELGARDGKGGPDHVYVIVQAGWEEAQATLPDPTGAWRLAWTTGEGRPAVETVMTGATLRVPRRSVTVLTDGRRARDSYDVRELHALAEQAGIDRQWWDINGNAYAVSDDTFRAILRAMRLPADRPDELEDSLGRVTREPWARFMAKVAVARSDEPPILELVVDQAAAPARLQLELRSEAGETIRIELDPEQAAVVASGELDGVARDRLRIALDRRLEPGHWEVRDAESGQEAMLLVAPPTCHLPPSTRAGGRLWGITIHLYSLRRQGDLGIGDFETLRRLVDATADLGGDIIGLNPFHTLFNTVPERASPYFPSDRRFLDLRYLVTDPADAAPTDAPIIDYTGVVARKLAWARERFARLSAAENAALDGFIAAGGDSLRLFATFQALEELHPDRDWVSWPVAARRPETAAGLVDPLAIRFHQCIQWWLDQQLAACDRHAAERGLEIGLYRDLAVGAAPFGAEVWTQQDLFASGVAVGSPPDPFSLTGQVWGVPPYDPRALVDQRLLPWRTLLETNMRHAGALRIDHAMALQRLFWVPAGAPASSGAYVRYPIDGLMAELTLASERARCTIIAEDLGTVPEGFEQRLADKDVLSTKVMWFERDGAQFRPPEAYPRRAAACLSTHDLPTFAGFWEGRDIALRASLDPSTDVAGLEAARAVERAALQEAVHASADDLASVDVAVHATLARTPSSLILAQAEDLVGEPDQVNLPGTDMERPNWRRKLAVPVEALATHPLARAVAAAISAARPKPAHDKTESGEEA